MLTWHDTPIEDGQKGVLRRVNGALPRRGVAGRDGIEPERPPPRVYPRGLVEEVPMGNG